MKMIVCLLCMSVVIFSCATTQELEKAISDKVVKRAAFDLNCPEKELSITKIDSSTYGSKGCNKQAAYKAIDIKSNGPCFFDNFAAIEDRCNIILNTDIRK